MGAPHGMFKENNLGFAWTNPSGQVAHMTQGSSPANLLGGNTSNFKQPLNQEALFRMRGNQNLLVRSGE